MGLRNEGPEKELCSRKSKGDAFDGGIGDGSILMAMFFVSTIIVSVF